MITRRGCLLLIFFSFVVLGGGGWYWRNLPRESQVIPTATAPLANAGMPPPSSEPLTPGNAHQAVQLARLGEVTWHTAHCRVSRITPSHEGMILLVVGALPPQCIGTPVNTSLEDAYLLLQHEQVAHCR